LNDQLAEDADVTVKMPKEVLYELATTNEKPDSSKIIIEGDTQKWNLFLFLQEPLIHNFNIMTPVPK
jgi:hypothetical protein